MLWPRSGRTCGPGAALPLRGSPHDGAVRSDRPTQRRAPALLPPERRGAAAGLFALGDGAGNGGRWGSAGRLSGPGGRRRGGRGTALGEGREPRRNGAGRFWRSRLYGNPESLNAAVSWGGCGGSRVGTCWAQRRRVCCGGPRCPPGAPAAPCAPPLLFPEAPRKARAGTGHSWNSQNKSFRGKDLSELLLCHRAQQKEMASAFKTLARSVAALSLWVICGVSSTDRSLF